MVTMIFRGALCLMLIGVAWGGCSKDEESGPTGTMIGQTKVDIDTRIITTHIGEAAVGDFMVDILKEELTKLGHTIDVAFLNAGAIRGGPVDPETFAFLTPEGSLGQIYPKGDLTDLQVGGWLPFKNDHVVAELTGVQLKSVLERSAHALPPNLRDEEGGWLLHASRMKYEIECSQQRQELDVKKEKIATEGKRVTFIQVGDRVVYDVANSIDKLSGLTIKIGVNNFIFDGNDGHLAFNEITQKTTIPLKDFDHIAAVQKYIKEHSPIEPKTDGRLKVVGECGKPGTMP